MTTTKFTNLAASSVFSLTNADAAALLQDGSLVQTDALLTAAGLADAAASVNTIFGFSISATITGITPHTWIADQNGLYHTATNLAAEWQNYYNQAAAGVHLTAIQHWEAQAEAVFLNTKLSTLSAAQQEIDREDTQREIDAVAAAMAKAGLSGITAMTTDDYLKIETTIAASPLLQELGIQGHGQNSPPNAKYNGYTQDFQNNVDTTTIYIGPGADNNDNALTDFYDDEIMTHLVFQTAVEWNGLEQKNQNAANEDQVAVSVGEANDAMFGPLLTASEFSQTPSAAPNNTPLPAPADSIALTATQALGYFGFAVDRTITISNPALGAGVTHVWVMDANGAYQLSSATNIAAEWMANYTILLNGTAAQKAALSDIQRLEANIQSIFLNTAMSLLPANQQATDRADIQRVLDVMAQGMAAAGMGATDAFTEQSWLTADTGLRNTADLQELYLQGIGSDNPTAPRYNGITNDISYGWNTDRSTLYVGGGAATGSSAVTGLLDRALLMPGIVAEQNGETYVIDQHGNTAVVLAQEIDTLNALMTTSVLTASAFTTPAAQALSQGTTLYGAAEPASGTITDALLGTSHSWVRNAQGLYALSGTDLAAEWKGYYAIMLAGKAATLTAIQRWEGNAEAVFENTAIGTSANVALYRQDIQRVIDVTSLAMTMTGLGANQLSLADYQALQTTIQYNALLEELFNQGQGLDGLGGTQYAGFVNQFKYNADPSTFWVGGGAGGGQLVQNGFVSNYLIGYLGNISYWSGGTLNQLDENNYSVGSAAAMLADLNTTLYGRVFVASDFSTSATAAGAVATVSATPIATDAAPVAGAGQILAITGQPIGATITGLAHVWTADARGLYQTSTDLTLEWATNQAQVAASPGTATWLQRAEANAQTIFQASGLNTLSEATQAQDRADIQRVLDAVNGAMKSAGLSTTTTLTTAQYVSLEQTLASNAQLYDLATEGRGLAGAGGTIYSGYENDFRFGLDTQAIFNGPGDDTGTRAVSYLLNDLIGGNLIFGVETFGAAPTTLSIAGNPALPLAEATQLFNTTATTLLTASQFGIVGASAPQPAPAGATSVTALDGTLLPASFTTSGHTWTADANGQYHTANLSLEWQTSYQTMLAGKGNTLTAWQRLQGNAEAIFENTPLYQASAAAEQAAREDIQRVIDAEAAAAQLAGVNTAAPLSGNAGIAINSILLGTSVPDETLEELARQGTGLWNTGLVKYTGYDGDLRWSYGNSINYVGGGLDNGQAVLGNFVDQVVLGGLSWQLSWQYGVPMEQNAWGAVGNSLQSSLTALNNLMYDQVLVASDFSTNPAATGAVVTIPGAQNPTSAAYLHTPPATEMVFDGMTIATTQMISNTLLGTTHVWVENRVGQFILSGTDIGAEWQGYYNTMQSGGAAGLTAIQRWEGNAQALFLNTALATSPGATAFRLDIQRGIDAAAAAMTTLGIAGTTPLTAAQYVAMANVIQSTPALYELSMESGGTFNAPTQAYNGYASDFQYGGDPNTYYVGGGANSGQNAVSSFASNFLVSHLGDVQTWQGGSVWSITMPGGWQGTAATLVADLNQTLFGRVYVASDFSTSATATGAVVTVQGQSGTTPANPTAGTGQMVTATGAIIANTITSLAHQWTAGSNTVFKTPTDLSVEWYNLYQTALANPTGLNWAQRAEANAEAIFLASNLSQQNETWQAGWRQDIQAIIDSVWGAMKLAGLSTVTQLSTTQYVTLSGTLRSNATLLELFDQGRGLAGGWSGAYNGYESGFRTSQDTQTIYTGTGPDSGQSAVATLLGDIVGGYLGFGLGYVNGTGTAAVISPGGGQQKSLAAATAALNFDNTAILTPAQLQNPNPPTAASATPLSVIALDGTVLAPVQTVSGHLWTADATGLYHTANLSQEWHALYQTMLAGQGNTLTAWQRLEGNAEAVIENTSIITWSNEAQLQTDREDIQRVIDAEAAAAKMAGVNIAAPLTTAAALAISNMLRAPTLASEQLEELALQGTGLWGTGAAKYTGFVNNFLWGGDNATRYVGGGFDNGQTALSGLVNDTIIGYLPFQTLLQNGQYAATNEGGSVMGSVQSITSGLNNLMFSQILVASDFSSSTTAQGQVVTIPGAQNPAAAAIVTTGAAQGQILTAAGISIAATETLNGHSWTADTTGTFHTASLASEWAQLYARAQTGDTSLTGVQHLEANLQACFQNSWINNANAATQQMYREDAQRVIDAFASAEGNVAITPTTVLTANSMQLITKAMDSNAVLAEFTAQGYGTPGSAAGTRYGGLNNDLYGADWQTAYMGTGYGTGEVIARQYIRDGVLADIGQPSTINNGTPDVWTTVSWQPLTLAQAVTNLNASMFTKTLAAGDFGH